MSNKTQISFFHISHQYLMLDLVGAVDAFLAIAYKLSFSAIIMYMLGGMNRSRKLTGSIALIFTILAVGSQWCPGLKESNLISSGTIGSAVRYGINIISWPNGYVNISSGRLYNNKSGAIHMIDNTVTFICGSGASIAFQARPAMRSRIVMIAWSRICRMRLR